MGKGTGRNRPGIEIQHLVAADKQRKEKVGNTTIDVRDLQRQYGDDWVIVAEAFMRVGFMVYTGIGHDKGLDTAECLDAYLGSTWEGTICRLTGLLLHPLWSQQDLV